MRLLINPKTAHAMAKPGKTASQGAQQNPEAHPDPHGHPSHGHGVDRPFHHGGGGDVRAEIA